MISNMLCKNGFNTGLFISPYVTDFRERIQYNGNMIEKAELAQCVEKVKAATDEFEGEHRTVYKRGEGSGSVCFRGGLSNLGTH